MRMREGFRFQQSPADVRFTPDSVAKVGRVARLGTFFEF
jgi:hypothetical protein